MRVPFLGEGQIVTPKPLRKVTSSRFLRGGKRTSRILRLECGHEVPQSGRLFPVATRARCGFCLREMAAGTEAL